MAVCNRFNALSSDSGNFLMFSQYVEDITCNFVNGDSYKVVPSKFIALNINYSNIDIPNVDSAKNLNEDIPRFFQNYYENGCAYGRSNSDVNWTSECAKNLFWNALFNGKFLSTTATTEDTDRDGTLIDEIATYTINEIVNIEDVGLHSYNEHNGMGYGEVYCYIPTNSNAKTCKVTIKPNQTSKENKGTSLEGLPEESIGNYSKLYYYNEDHELDIDNKENNSYNNLSNLNNYPINTIIVLYDVLQKTTDGWTDKHEDIPMGIYFTGNFDASNNIKNTITKFVHDDFGVGSSYGLRICTRFSVSPNSANDNVVEVNSDNSYEGIGQLMTKMSENLACMLDVVKSTQASADNYKDLLSIFRNNRTNVPYCKNVNGADYWFVNGRLAGTTTVNPTIVDDVLDNITYIPEKDLEDILSENNFPVLSDE